MTARHLDPVIPKAIFPKGALIGAALLVAFTVTTSAISRISGLGTVQMPETSAVETRSLRFEDMRNGSIQVTDARTGKVAASVEPGTNGFVRGTLRGLARERKRRGIGIEPPFMLTRWADGRISLEDPETGRVIELDAFGPTNGEAFAQLLTAGRN